MTDFLDKNFFIIDSDNLTSVSSKFYGYYLEKNGFFCEKNFDLNTSDLSGRGCYVFVHRTEDTITISQDFMGAFGLYLFRHDDYFALSNSFNLLLDYIKQKYPISFNRDYANHFLLMDLVSLSYSDTMISEIKILPKSAKVSINISGKTLGIEFIDYKEASVSLDSREGLAALDRWYESWISIIRNINDHTDQLTFDLSGGFDSRISFLLAKCSGISLDNIRVNSKNDNLHTHTEDFAIATEISKHFNFDLNKILPKINYRNLSLDEIIKAAWYTMIPFHKEIYFKQVYFFEPRFRISGAGGESIRAYWDLTPDELVEKFCKPALRNYPEKIGRELYDSCRTVVLNAIEEVKKLYAFDPEDKTGLSIPSMVYRQIRCRNHFGRDALHNYLINLFTLAPLCDPDLYKIRLKTFDCDDQNLLMALIFVRYCPELLDFPFDNNRCINKETIDKAHSINKHFPYVKRKNSNSDFIYPSFSQKEADEPLMKNDKSINITEVDNYMLRLFRSPVIKHTFVSQYDKTIYDYAASYYRTHALFPMRHCNAIVAISKILLDISMNQTLFQEFGKEYFDKIINNVHPEISEETIPVVFKNYLTARIDINLEKGNSGDFEITEISDDHADCKTPLWFQKNGYGMIITSLRGSLDFKLKINNSGTLKIWLRGKDVRDKSGNRIPIWIDYQKFLLNEKEIFNEKTSIWHDKPFLYAVPVTEGEILSVHLQWLPYLLVFFCNPPEAAANNNEIKVLNSEIDELKINTLLLTEENANLNKDNSKEYLDDVLNSTSWKIGSAITRLPGIIKRKFMKK